MRFGPAPLSRSFDFPSISLFFFSPSNLRLPQSTMSNAVSPSSTLSVGSESTLGSAPPPATITSLPAEDATHPPYSIVLQHPQALSAEYHDRHSTALNIYYQTFTELMGEFFATSALAQKWVFLNQLKQNLEWAKDDIELLKKRRDIEARMYDGKLRSSSRKLTGSGQASPEGCL